MLNYNNGSDTIVGSLQVKPASRLDFGLNLVWSQADAGFSSFPLFAPATYLAGKPNQSYDFSNAASYSDLDLTRIEAGLTARYELSGKMWLSGQYRYVDLQDDAPYIEDESGTVEYVTLGLGFRF